MSGRRGYHVTTPAKLARYEATGVILPPVRFWGSRDLAERWLRRVGRSIVLSFDWPDPTYPLPDHRMFGPSPYWTPSMVRKWRIE